MVTTAWRLLCALAGGLALAGVTVGANSLFRVRQIPKGWRAPYTMRAPSDVVWNQQELPGERAKSFLVFYDETADVLDDRRAAILEELAQLQPTFWHFPEQEGGEAIDEATTAHRSEAVAELGSEILALLAPMYRDGVIADDEFPAREQEIRIYRSDAQDGTKPGAPAAAAPDARPVGGHYRRQRVAGLHRFSELRPAAERSLDRYFSTFDPTVRRQVLDFMLDRLPPNLRYSRTNADHIADRSIVTGQRAVLVRAGDILVRRGQIIDTRAESALSAALEAQPARGGQVLSIFLLFVAVSLLGSQAIAAAGPSLARPGVQAGVLTVFVLVLGIGRAALAAVPLAATAVPLAALAAGVGTLSGPRGGVVVAILAASYAALGLAFNLTTFAVILAGGVALALTAPHERWRARVKKRPRGPFGVARQRLARAVGCTAGAAVIQGACFAACVSLAGQRVSVDAVFGGAQAIGSGALAGILGLGAASMLERAKARRRRALADPGQGPVLDRHGPRATVPTP
jgi:hypothetical protein